MKNQEKMSANRMWTGVKNGLLYASLPFLVFSLIFAWRIDFFSWWGKAKTALQQSLDNDPVLRAVTTGVMIALFLSACVLLLVERKRKLGALSISFLPFILSFFIFIRKIGLTAYLSSQKETMKNGILNFCEDQGIDVILSIVKQYFVEHHVIIDILIVLLVVICFVECCLGFINGVAAYSDEHGSIEDKGNEQ